MVLNVDFRRFGKFFLKRSSIGINFWSLLQICSISLRNFIKNFLSARSKGSFKIFFHRYLTHIMESIYFAIGITFSYIFIKVQTIDCIVLFISSLVCGNFLIIFVIQYWKLRPYATNITGFVFIRKFRRQYFEKRWQLKLSSYLVEEFVCFFSFPC